MGRLIDADKLKDILEYAILANVSADNTNTNEEKWNDWIQSVIDRTPAVEAIPKDQYEARLKADMVAMLNELKYDLYHGLCKEIHDKEDCPCTNQTTSCLATFRVCDADRAIGNVIQQKINKLKGESK